MGKVQGNIQCSDRLDIRSEGTVTGDVITPRISVEDGAVLKGSVQVKTAEVGKHQHPSKPAESVKSEQPKSLATIAGA
jgi:cytoskeletal protein CcmA (bactofilin family)